MLFLCGFLLNSSQLIASEGAAASSRLGGRGETKPSEDAREEVFEYKRDEKDPWASVDMAALNREMPFPGSITKVSDFHALGLPQKVAFLMGMKDTGSNEPDLSLMKKLADLRDEADRAVLSRLISRIITKLGIRENPDLQLILEHVVCAHWDPRWSISQPFEKFTGVRSRGGVAPYLARVAEIYRREKALGSPIIDADLERNLDNWTTLPDVAATYLDNYESRVDRFVENEFNIVKATYLINSDRLIARARLEHEELARAQATIRAAEADARRAAEEARRMRDRADEAAKRHSEEAKVAAERLDMLAARRFASGATDRSASSRAVAEGAARFQLGAEHDAGASVHSLLQILEEVRTTPYHILAGMEWERMTAIMKETIERDSRIKSQEKLPPLSAVLKNPRVEAEEVVTIDDANWSIFTGTLGLIYRALYALDLLDPVLPRTRVEDLATLQSELLSDDVRVTKIVGVFPRSLAFWKQEAGITDIRQQRGLIQKLAHVTKGDFPLELANVVMTIGGDSQHTFRAGTDINYGDDLITKAIMQIRNSDLVKKYEAYKKRVDLEASDRDHIRENMTEAENYFKHLPRGQRNFLLFLVKAARGAFHKKASDISSDEAHESSKDSDISLNAVEVNEARAWLKYLNMLRVMRSEALVLLSGWMSSLSDEIVVAGNPRVWGYEKNIKEDLKVKDDTRTLKQRLSDLLVVRSLDADGLAFFRLDELRSEDDKLTITFLSEEVPNTDPKKSTPMIANRNIHTFALNRIVRDITRDIFTFVLMPTDPALGELTKDSSRPLDLKGVIEVVDKLNKKNVVKLTKGKSIPEMRDAVRAKFLAFRKQADMAMPKEHLQKLERRAALASAVAQITTSYEKHKEKWKWKTLVASMEKTKGVAAPLKAKISEISNFAHADYLDKMMKDLLGEDFGFDSERGRVFQSQFKESQTSPNSLEQHLLYLFDLLDDYVAPSGGAGSRDESSKEQLFTKYIELSESLDLGNVALQIRFYNIFEKLVEDMKELYQQAKDQYPWLLNDRRLPPTDLGISEENLLKMRAAIKRVLASYIIDFPSGPEYPETGKPFHDKAPDYMVPVNHEGTKDRTRSFAMMMYNSKKRARDFTDALEVLKAFSDDKIKLRSGERGAGPLLLIQSQILKVMETNAKLMSALELNQGAYVPTIDDDRSAGDDLPQEFAYRIDEYWPDSLEVLSEARLDGAAGGVE